MLGLKNIQTIIGLITLFIAYLITIAPAGCFRAWVAKKMGDETGEELGFLTLNPFAHLDFFGLTWLLIFSRPEAFSGFGWGRHVPINPLNIHGRFRWLKITCAFFSDTLAHMTMATIALITFTIAFNGKSLSMTALQASSLSLVTVQLLFAFVGLNISLALVQCVINIVLLIALYVIEGNTHTISYMYYFIFIAPLAILLLFGVELQYMMFYAIRGVEQCVMHLVNC